MQRAAAGLVSGKNKAEQEVMACFESLFDDNEKVCRSQSPWPPWCVALRAFVDRNVWLHFLVSAVSTGNCHSISTAFCSSSSCQRSALVSSLHVTYCTHRQDYISHPFLLWHSTPDPKLHNTNFLTSGINKQPITQHNNSFVVLKYQGTSHERHFNCSLM